MIAFGLLNSLGASIQTSAEISFLDSLKDSIFYSIHSQNRVHRETAPAGNGRDTYKFRHAREAPSFEKSRDTAYPEK